MANNVYPSEDDYYINGFYGTYDHFQRIGWYFDKIVYDLDDLDNCVNVMTGRFVLVMNENAVFLRTGNSGDNTYTQNAIVSIDPTTHEVSYNSGNTNPITITKGFKFIGYITPHAKLLLDQDGSFIDINTSNFMIPYKIANDEYVKRISAYYFPTSHNQNIWNNTPSNDPIKVIKFQQVANIRSTYDSSADIIGIVGNDNSVYCAYDSHNDTNGSLWYLITAGQYTGWVLASATRQAKCKIIATQANLYDQPDEINGTIISTLSGGDTVYSIFNISNDNQWYKFRISDQASWIQIKDTTIVSEEDTGIPVPTDPTEQEDV